MTEQVATNITWHEGSVSRDERFEKSGQTGCVLWFTGLSGSGKSTLACALDSALVNLGKRCYCLDGDNIRHGLNKNLGFSAEDRTENIRRIGEVAMLFADAGIITLTAFISPYTKDRATARAACEDNGLKFVEVYMDTPLAVAEERDPKGLYKKARAGEIKGFTGIDDPYDEPENAELVIKTAELTLDEEVRACVKYLEDNGFLKA